MWPDRGSLVKSNPSFEGRVTDPSYPQRETFQAVVVGDDAVREDEILRKARDSLDRVASGTEDGGKVERPETPELDTG